MSNDALDEGLLLHSTEYLRDSKLQNKLMQKGPKQYYAAGYKA